MYRRTLAIGVSTLLTVAMIGCSYGPSTQEQVCASFDELGQQVLQGNGIIGNPLFHKAGALADVAARYPNSPGVTDDAKRLRRIADASSTSVAELMNATTNIAALCGHPLGIGRNY